MGNRRANSSALCLSPSCYQVRCMEMLPHDSLSVNCICRPKQSTSGFLHQRAQVQTLGSTDNRSISGHGSCWGKPASENPAFVPPLCLTGGLCCNWLIKLTGVRKNIFSQSCTDWELTKPALLLHPPPYHETAVSGCPVFLPA